MPHYLGVALQGGVFLRFLTGIVLHRSFGSAIPNEEIFVSPSRKVSEGVCKVSHPGILLEAFWGSEENLHKANLHRIPSLCK